MDTCRSCSASIVWALTPSGKRAPVDREPVEEGNILLLRTNALEAPLAVVLTGEGLGAAQHSPVGLRLNHFVTCPNAKHHREEADEKALAKGAVG